MMLSDVQPKTEFDDARLSGIASRASQKRKTTIHRGGIGHPATSEQDYSREELEFFSAIQEFQNRTGKKFPTWSEVLRVMKSLGYNRD